MKKILRKEKYPNRRRINFLIFILVATSFTLGLITGTFNFASSDINYQELAYKNCKAFNFMAYLNAENLRHYSNSTFEYTTLPNCEWIYDKNEDTKVSYNDWLQINNISHLNWNGTNK